MAVGPGAAAGREPDGVTGRHGHGVPGRSPAAVHNNLSDGVIGSVVQAGSIRDVVVTAGTPPTRRRWGAESAGRGLDEWAEGLAQGVRTLWEREEEHRRVHDPVALPVRWHPATPELADQWVNICRVPAGATAEPLALAGRIEHLAQLYRSVPSRRLVILGPAGAGKTVLASRLVLDLLASPRPGEPVPVIFSVGSWNPTTTPLNLWMAGQLARDHPGLAAPAGPGGATRAAALIEAGRVLPILDGFDEIHPGLHQDALRRLNATPDAPLVITSRVAEYTTAVRGAKVLTAAAVAELDDLTLDDLAAYLPRTAAGHRSGLWDPVLERMRTEPNDPGAALLRGVLTNPLMVFLARTIYSDTPGHDPAELLDTHRFPTEQALQGHLLAAFVPAVYQADQPNSTRRQWPDDRARRYLTYLAGHLHRAGTRDLAWWQLRDTIPRWHRTLIFALVDGLVTALAAGIIFVPTSGRDHRSAVIFGPMEARAHWSVVIFGLMAALASGLTVALTVGFSKPLRSRLPGKSRFLGTTIIALGTGLGTAFTVTPVYMLVFKYGVDLADWLAYGFVIGLVPAIMAGLIGLRNAGPQPTCTRLQIQGRARHVVGRFVVGVAVGFAVGLAVGLVNELTDAYAATANEGPTAEVASVVASAFKEGPTAEVAAEVAAASVVGIVVAFAGGFAFAFAFGLEAPADVADVVSAAESLVQDRRNTIRKMLVVAFVVAFVVASVLVLVLLVPGEDMLAMGLAGVVVVGFVIVRPTSAWIYWLVLVRGWLPLTGRLPWRFQAFLTDAYQRGVLRQTGAVYQFRHARLQDHLTTEPPAAGG